MKKHNKIGILLNIIMGVIYVPLSIFSWLLQMASESTMDATNPVYITLVRIFCVIAFLIPFLCVAAILLSVLIRKKGHGVLSIVISFIPLMVFILNLLLLAIAGTVPGNPG